MGFVVGFDEPSMMQGVKVLLVQKDGEILELGQTDGAGFLEVDRELLHQAGRVLLFCQQGYYCGAFMLSEEGFFEYEERYIELAPLAWQ